MTVQSVLVSPIGVTDSDPAIHERLGGSLEAFDETLEELEEAYDGELECRLWGWEDSASVSPHYGFARVVDRRLPAGDVPVPFDPGPDAAHHEDGDERFHGEGWEVFREDV